MSQTPKWFGYDPMVILTVVIAAAAIVSVFASLGALGIARRALALTDRPYVVVEVASIHLHNWEQPVTTPNGRSVSFGLKNYGKGPAVLARVLVHAVVFKESDLQEQPTPVYRYNEAETPPGGLIVPDQAVFVQLSGPSLALSEGAYDQWRARNPRQGNLFLYGYVDYDDMLGNRHRFCFAYRIVDWEPRPPYWMPVNNRAYWCSN